MAREAYQNLENEEKELKARLVEIEIQKSPLKNYMKSVGLIEIKKRGPSRKRVAEVNV